MFRMVDRHRPYNFLVIEYGNLPAEAGYREQLNCERIAGQVYILFQTTLTTRAATADFRVAAMRGRNDGIIDIRHLADDFICWVSQEYA
jgi:hypothetical protein